MSPISESEHCKIEAKVDSKYNIVESHEISDPSRGLRRAPVRVAWQTERLIGRGGFAKVFLQFREGKEDDKRALKVIPALGQELSDEECRRELLALIEFTKPKYKNAAVFVDFLGWFQDDNAMYLMMEYMPLGDLEHNVHQAEKASAHSGLPISEGEAKEISRQILEGLKIMHEEGFAHRDLKPQNVFVVQRHPRWWVKLGDFGLSKRQIEGTAYRTQAGTVQYMAPELFYFVEELDSETSEYTSAIDLWSLGCIIHRVLTGTVPFPTPLSLRKYCKDPSKAPLKMPPAMEEAMCFVQDLLMPNPSKRPVASAALENIWLSSKDESKSTSDDVQTSFAELSISGSGNAYNTASHIGLQSFRTLRDTRKTALGPSIQESTSEPPPSSKMELDIDGSEAVPGLEFRRVGKPERRMPAFQSPPVDKYDIIDRPWSILIYIENSRGPTFGITVPPESTVYEVKKEVHKIRGYLPQTQALTYRGFQLSDNTTIEHYGIHQHSTIILVLGTY